MLASFVASVAAVLAMLRPARAAPRRRAERSTRGCRRATSRSRSRSASTRSASVMILVVTGIGSLIHIYSTAYMHEESDSEYARYFSYLNLFASFMLVLVLGATSRSCSSAGRASASAPTC